MKNLLPILPFYLLIAILCHDFNAQIVNIEGKLKISQTDTLNSSTTMLIKEADGTPYGQFSPSIPDPQLLFGPASYQACEDWKKKNC